MNPPIEGDNPANREGQGPQNQKANIEAGITRELELQESDPVRKGMVDLILQIEKLSNPNLQMPDNFKELLRNFNEKLRGLSDNQRRGLEKLFPEFGQRDLSKDELNRMVEKVMAIYFRIPQTPEQEAQPFLPPFEMPDANPDSRLDPANIQRNLMNGYEGIRRPPKVDEEEVWVYNTNYQREMPVYIKKTLEAMQKEMRSRLNRAESFSRGFSDPMSGVAEPLQEVVMWIRALEQVGNQELGDSKTQTRGRERIEWAKQLRDEFDARAFLHEFFIYFLGEENEDKLFSNAQMMKSRYFHTYFKFKEVQESFLLLEKNAERYLRSRGETRTSKGATEDHAETKGDVRFALTREMAEIISQEQGGEKVQAVKAMTDEEINREFSWALNMAERVWRISARPAMYEKLEKKGYEKLEKKGDEADFIGEAFNHDLLYRRALNPVNWAIANKKGFYLWPPLLAGADLSNKDFFSRALRFIEDAEKPNIEAQILRTDYGGRNKETLNKEEKKEFDSKVDKGLYDYFVKEFNFGKKWNEEKKKYEWPTLVASKQEIEHGMATGQGQDTVKFAKTMNEKTWRALFTYDWEKLSETSYRGWHFLDVVYVEKLRKQHIGNDRAQESFLANPGAKTLANVYKEIQYRGGSIPDIMTQLLENTWTYMAHERKQHTGMHNANWDELETMLANTIESNVVTHGMAREAMKKAVKNDLLILYKDIEKYLSWWQFLLGLIFDTLKEGLKPVPT